MMRRAAVAAILLATAACGVEQTASEAVRVPNVPAPSTSTVSDVPLEAQATTTTTTTAALLPATAMDIAASVSEPLVESEGRVAGETIPVPPPPWTWTGPLPNYGGRGACTQQEANDVSERFAAAGASWDSQLRMLTIFSRETGCDHTKRNQNSNTGDDSFGPCQLNALSGHFGPNGVLKGWDRWRILTDWYYAIDACVTMWITCGFGPWNYGNYYCSKPAELR